ncbi:MAG: (2R)-sulfolactate sulfo-lyase subunit alpha [Spirochaetes bacterium ADurb.Bin315]|jgi:altronate dehydratase small subunit|nr:UxaA family hydrolase [Spirochaetota bacterium]NLL24505.1 UxaA family hydrolase [Spirochaetales bacterium]OQA44236.1 MAG: (2R)-sulfolactate sulfo-lyase subunit alpha [Spirochaetes bacterium ADurb.Bin315]TAH57100.1 MAG: D-galactarate dehydratase [Sphaerochaeta sp.]HOE88492.1 UxaA family hydrolase [Sphaerochaeta sp.]
MVKAIKLHDSDNVASVFDSVVAGAVVQIIDKKGASFELVVSQDIPYGHKVAIAEVGIGEQVTKYGEEIGIASVPIHVGEHVHVHNIESIRGRGDWDESQAEKVKAGIRKEV